MAKLFDDGHRLKGDDGPNAADLRHADAVRRAANVAAAGNAFSTSPAQKAEARAAAKANSGTTHILLSDLQRAAPLARKADVIPLHPSVVALAPGLTPNAERLLSLFLEVEAQHPKGELLDLLQNDIAEALKITTIKATEARKELVASGLIERRDNFSGHSGYVTKLGKR
ncbi:hypothetical protein KX816_09880 [Sphingosinicellaceae bacterium]|nr:hypothetical protein KX816_09880 [Sphingosinicellaceae bacterium]